MLKSFRFLWFGCFFSPFCFFFFFFNDTATTEIYTLSLHDALPISPPGNGPWFIRLALPKATACAPNGSSAISGSSSHLICTLKTSLREYAKIKRGGNGQVLACAIHRDSSALWPQRISVDTW